MPTEAKFNAIIAMLKGGATDDVIMSSQGINENTLDRIKRSNGSFETFKKLHGEFIRRHGNLSKGKGSTGNGADTVYGSNRLLEEMKIQNEHLKTISAKLAFIVEELTGKEV